MITLTTQAIQNHDDARGAAWRHALRMAFRDPHELLEYLGLPADLIAGAEQPIREFPLLVPRGYAARMQRGDPHDPLLRQVLPLGIENAKVPGFVADPVGDLTSLAGPGLLHKYQGRALLIATGACAIHCRYCFRRHFPYAEASASRGHWAEVLETLRAHPEIDEIILSGGDPLMLDDDKLGELVSALEHLPQLRRLRVHTRLPIVLPERVDDALLAWIGRSRLQVICVIHANHANELDHSVAHALTRLRDVGVTLLNQSVLLRGVNDHAEILSELSLRLFECGVMPYYLHLLDPVAGAAHFEIEEQDATHIVRAVRARLPGYLVPRLVREEAGQPSKTDIPL
ncbi:EF-P beta-lysylation protein EpmB [Acidihalobacter yilgarnensis]|uniref:L-lysine 2,3-aminomutase n=1 Tax=Acidihalobacter yilgarnensis TaxID=2819280 RepID=A0A1D8IMF8_9GAMM|nr:EF-P beta-lysylation protein EpmB [Acidihalobacter yilgarnensis]AOU97605.1 EF-P beta-lysylation protein EpmB [Acidihalobacter yilgarnensis]